MSSNDRERSLIERIARRDASAAAELFDAYSDEIFGYLVRRMSPQDAEDRLHEVFLRALRGASRFRGDAELRSWLYGITRNVLLESRRDRFDLRSGLDRMDSGPGPISLIIGNEERRRLLWALETLPDEQAIVFELHHLDGLGHSEIGALLGILPATSRKRLQRASIALRRKLEVRGRREPPRHGGLDSWRRSLRVRALGVESTS